MSRTSWVLLFLILMLGVPFCSSTTVASRTGNIAVTIGNNPAAVSWTQTGTYTNVDISAMLGGHLGNPGTGDLYLMNSIGPGTTVANQLDFITLTLPGATYSTMPTLVFSGLTLGPGTYYLVLNDTNNLGFIGLSSPVETADGGVTINADLLGMGASDPYPPATTLAPFDREIGFSVTGNAVTATPEPSSVLLIGSSLAAFAGVLRRKLFR